MTIALNFALLLGKRTCIIDIPWFSFLDPYPLSQLYVDQNTSDRETLYTEAQNRITTDICNEAEKYGIEHTIIKSDYTRGTLTLHIRNNETFESVFELGYHNDSKYLFFDNCFHQHM